MSAQRSEPHPEGSRSTLGRSMSHEGLRQEIWIRPDSGATYCRTLSSSNNEDEDDKDDELKKMPVEQVCVPYCSVTFHCVVCLCSCSPILYSIHYGKVTCKSLVLVTPLPSLGWMEGMISLCYICIVLTNFNMTSKLHRHPYYSAHKGKWNF